VKPVERGAIGPIPSPQEFVKKERGRLAEVSRPRKQVTADEVHHFLSRIRLRAYIPGGPKMVFRVSTKYGVEKAWRHERRNKP